MSTPSVGKSSSRLTAASRVALGAGAIGLVASLVCDHQSSMVVLLVALAVDFAPILTAFIAGGAAVRRRDPIGLLGIVLALLAIRPLWYVLTHGFPI